MKQASYLSVLGLTLKELREEKNIKQKELAEALSITTAGWSKVEKGQSALSVPNLNKASKVLEMSASSIIEKVEGHINYLEGEGWVISDDKVKDDNLSLGWGFASGAAVGSTIAAISNARFLAPFIIGNPVTIGAVVAAVAGYAAYKSLEDKENESEDSPSK